MSGRQPAGDDAYDGLLEAARAATRALYTPAVVDALATLERLAPALLAGVDAATPDRAAEALWMLCERALVAGVPAPDVAMVRRVLARQPSQELGMQLRTALAPMLGHAGRVEDALGDLDDVIALSSRSHEVHGRALLARGALRRRHLDDLEGAERDARTALALARAYRRPVHEVEALSNLASLGSLVHDERRRLARTALRLARADGNRVGALGPLGTLLGLTPPPPDPHGLVLAEEALALALEVGFSQAVFVFGSTAARLALELDRPVASSEARDAAFEICDRLGWAGRRRQLEALLAATAWSLDPAVDPRPALVRSLLDPHLETHAQMLRAVLAAASAEATGACPQEPPDGPGDAVRLCRLAVDAWVAVGTPVADSGTVLARARKGLRLGDDALGSVRLARRALRRAVSALDAWCGAVVVGPGGAWFRTGGGERVSLAPRRILRRLLVALADADAPLSVEALFEVGWPGQRIRAESAAHRVHVAVAELRRHGLGEALATVDGGYRLVGPVRHDREDVWRPSPA